MKTVKSFILATFLIGLLGCAGTVPPARPLDDQKSVIDIAVKTRPPLKLFGGSKSNQVYFLRMAEGDSTYMVGDLLSSNFSKDGQMYLLNAEPGRYVVVAAYHSKSTAQSPASTGPAKPGVSVSVGVSTPSETHYTTFFAREVIKLTEITVAPGSMVFMGNYVVDQSTGMKDADETQAYFFNLVRVQFPDACVVYNRQYTT